MKKVLSAFILLLMLVCTRVYGEERVDTLTYAVFPYLPDAGYYQELIETRFAELEPDIQLVRADWDCYYDGAPDGIDVIMYDAIMRDALIEAGWIQPVRKDAVQGAEDIYPFTLEAFTVGDALYGLPVFLCGNFLIYDEKWEALAEAEHITDLADQSEILVVNTENPVNRPQYAIEVMADARGEANPFWSDVAANRLEESLEDSMLLIDRLAIDLHKQDDDTQVAMAYDSGIGQGYIGFSESMCLLKNRLDQTWIKAVSFSDRENIPRVYADAAAVAAGIEGERYEKCLELLNVMADAEVLTALSVKEGAPQYLLIARESPYQILSESFPIYEQLEHLAGNERNQVILTP